MKYCIILLGILSAIMMGCNEDYSNSDWHMYNLNGKAKLMRETEFEVKDKSTFKRSKYIIFNKKGYIVKKEEYFDHKDNLVLDLTYNYVFDNNGRKIKQLDYDSSDNLLYIHEFIYGPDGPILEKRRNIENKINQKIEYFYYTQEDSKLHEKVVYGANNQLESKTSTYFNHGKKDIEIIKNNFTSFITNDPDLTIFVIHQYDDNGNILNSHYPRLFTRDRSFEYVFDNKNNWTIKKGFNNDKNVSITRREIEYY